MTYKVLRKVSFNYPGTHRSVVNDLSFSAKRGEMIAIVGENGSGKTTMVKCFFYINHYFVFAMIFK